MIISKVNFDLKYPFLGVHFTVTVDGKTKIGPTAIPAFWREQYGIYKNFQLGEFSEILLRQSTLFFSSDFNFKQLAIQEIQKYSKTKLVNLAADLVHNIDLSSFKKWGNPGIRAQLINITTKKLEMDFVFEGDHKSFHILNAVSPGFTCCLPFSEYVCDKIIEKIK
jgi:L-2-hydroxyglutarate oxidase LhgO